MLTDKLGQTGFYTVLATHEGDIYCGHASGRVLTMMPIEMSKWKEHFYLEFKKIGLMRYQFRIINRLTGHACTLFAWRGFGKVLLNIINAQQQSTVNQK